MFTPIIPPSAPVNTLVIIIIIEVIFNKKFPVTILDNKYIMAIYINPTNIPFIIPFFFMFDVLIVLPISTLIAVIIITIVGIVLSETLVQLSIIE